MGQSASTPFRQHERPQGARNRRSFLPSSSTSSDVAASANTQPILHRTRSAAHRSRSINRWSSHSTPPEDAPRFASRLHRARRSFSSNLPSILSRIHPNNGASAGPTLASTGPSTPATDAPSLPSFNFSAEDLSIGTMPPILEASHPVTPIQTRPASPASSRGSLHRTPIGSIADRIQSLTPDRSFRSLVRRRRDPAPGSEDQHATLSRMLSVAAAATAASLVGSGSEEAVHAARNTIASIEGDDGNFEQFLESLRSGRLNSIMTGDNSANSLQYFRVFQFGSHSRRPNNEYMRVSSDDDRTDSRTPNGGADEEHGEGRMVPVLMIGIRSLTGEDTAGGESNDLAIPSLFESFGGDLDLDRQSSRDSATFNGLMRSGRNGLNFSQRRRASMGGMGLFSQSGRDAGRRSQRVSDAARPRSEVVEPATESSTPPGPYPPPTTPSSPPMSSVPSGASTPNRRASVSSMARRASSINTEREFHHRATHTALEATEEEESIGAPRPARARRLSESDFMRYGSGSSRRNGVVEPDHAPGRENSRSWIIYVLGGNYPENHPILTTPSLFTDSPTYEDMLLLSSMLGPAKPPVASKEDISAAGGLYTLQPRSGIASGMRAQLLGGSPNHAIQLEPEQKCPVCLCEFEQAEVVRRLKKCQHLFHQPCIDEWLTTGRNACPLCRGEGVPESSGQAQEAGEPSRTAATGRMTDV